jgi:hypothetical protein
MQRGQNALGILRPVTARLRVDHHPEAMAKGHTNPPFAPISEAALRSTRALHFACGAVWLELELRG